MAAPTPARGISFHVTIIVAPENASKFLESSRQVFKDIAAEPKCLYFSLVESAEQKGKFKIVENWAMSFGEFQKVGFLCFSSRGREGKVLTLWCIRNK